jgi:microcompartment protein CcmK/EutM
LVVAKVIGEIVSSVKVDRMVGQKLLLVEIQKLDRTSPDTKLIPTGTTLVANDPVGAGRDEIVLVVQGSSARMTDITATLPTDGIIIGIVDSINIESETIYNKNKG